MPRYIDANKIDYTVTMVGIDENAGYRAVAFESDIDAMPTADVVEVVRCKDCKHSSFLYSCGKYMCKKGCGATKTKNDFCSYGDRKES